MGTFRLPSSSFATLILPLSSYSVLLPLSHRGLIPQGVARLILESRNPPLVLPLYHHGISSVMPLDIAWFPRPFKNIIVNFGEAIDSAKWIDECEEMEGGWRERREWVTNCVQEEVEKLKLKTMEIAKEDKCRRVS